MKTLVEIKDTYYRKSNFGYVDGYVGEGNYIYACVVVGTEIERIALSNLKVIGTISDYKEYEATQGIKKE